MVTHTTTTEPRKKDLALAFIIERIARFGTPPSLAEIARELGVSVTRVKVLIEQLEREGLVERTPGAQRALRVVDVAHSRQALDVVFERLGWIRGSLSSAIPFPKEHLPMLPELEHIPDLDWPGAAA